MQTQTRTNRQVFDIPGTITSPDGFEVEVHFDLIEFEELIDGFPGPKSSYGVLRFADPLDPSIEPRLLSATHLVLTGGGMQTGLCLYRLNSFTLTESLHEFPGRLNFSLPAGLTKDQDRGLSAFEIPPLPQKTEAAYRSSTRLRPGASTTMISSASR